MSITITVGNQKPVQIEDKGAEGVIDTPEDATAALTVLGNDEKLTANGKEYTRDELVKIRDDAPKSEAGDQATARGEGVSHGVFVQGAGSGGFDKDADPADPESRSHKGHNGGRVRVGYQAGIPVMNGEHQLNVDLRAGLEVGHAGTEYETPGGETATSSYTYGGPSLSAALRYVTPSPFYASIGILATIAGFGSEDGTTVSLPSSCTPGDFARGECEPGAGPRSAPGGSDGLYRPRTGSSRPTDGVLVYAGVPVTAGAEVASGEWGNVGVAGVFEPGYTRLVPSDGDGTGFLSLSGGGEVIVNVGGGAARAAAVTEDKDADGVADTDDECPSEAGPADNKGCPMEKLEGVETIGVVSAQAPDGAGQQFLVKLDPPRNGTITKAEIVGKDKTYGADVDPTKLSQTGELTVTPKEKLPAGKYTFRFELEENGEKKVGQAAFEVKDIAALDVKITPDAANAPAEKTASEVSFGVVTNKAITIAPRFVLQGQTAGLQKNYYPDPKAYEVDASQIGQATSFSFKTPDTLPAGTYTVIFDVKAEDGTTKRLSTTMTIAPKPKTVEVASVRKTGSSPYIGDRLSVWVTMEKEAPEDTSVDVVVGNAKASGVVKKGQKESEEIKVWGPGQARSAAGGGEHVIQATPKGGKTFNGPSVSVPGGGGGAPGPKGPRKPAGQ